MGNNPGHRSGRSGRRDRREAPRAVFGDTQFSGFDRRRTFRGTCFRIPGRKIRHGHEGAVPLLRGLPDGKGNVPRARDEADGHRTPYRVQRGRRHKPGPRNRRHNDHQRPHKHDTGASIARTQYRCVGPAFCGYEGRLQSGYDTHSGKNSIRQWHKSVQRRIYGAPGPDVRNSGRIFYGAYTWRGRCGHEYRAGSNRGAAHGNGSVRPVDNNGPGTSRQNGQRISRGSTGNRPPRYSESYFPR